MRSDLLQPAFTLAQAGPAPGSSVGQIVALLGLGIVLVVVGTLVILYLRRRLLERQRSASEPGFLLDDLRDLRRSGQISEAEFDAAKAAITARLRGEPLPPPRQGPGTSAGAAPGSSGSAGGAKDKPPEVRIAPAGYDLTGEPLPPPAPEP